MSQSFTFGKIHIIPLNQSNVFQWDFEVTVGFLLYFAFIVKMLNLLHWVNLMEPESWAIWETYSIYWICINKTSHCTNVAILNTGTF